MRNDSGLRVLVTDAERPTALAIIRSLRARGHWVAAASADTRVPAWRSRATRARVRYPSPRTDAAGAVTRIAQVCRNLAIDVVFPVTDDIGLPLARARDRIPATVLLPEPDAMQAVTDKEATLRLAARSGVPVPRTVIAGSAQEALAHVAELGWPIVVKPRFSRSIVHGAVRTHEVTFAWNEAELAASIRALEPEPGALLQAYVVGHGVGVELLLDRGRLVAAFQHRRIHEVPLTGGASSLRESVALDPVLLDHSLRLLGALRWTGLAMVEYRVGPEGPALMEVNGRPWGSLPLAVMAGVDFPAMCIDLVMGRGSRPTVQPAYRHGLRARNLELETLWIGAVLRGRDADPRLPVPSRSEGVRALLGLLDPTVRDDVFAVRDPLPWLVLLERVGTKLVSKALGARPRDA